MIAKEKCFDRIFWQILSTHFLRKFMEVSLENLHVDIEA